MQRHSRRAYRQPAMTPKATQADVSFLPPAIIEQHPDNEHRHLVRFTNRSRSQVRNALGQLPCGRGHQVSQHLNREHGLRNRSIPSKLSMPPSQVTIVGPVEFEYRKQRYVGERLDQERRSKNGNCQTAARCGTRAAGSGFPLPCRSTRSRQGGWLASSESRHRKGSFDGARPSGRIHKWVAFPR